MGLARRAARPRPRRTGQVRCLQLQLRYPWAVEVPPAACFEVRLLPALPPIALRPYHLAASFTPLQKSSFLVPCRVRADNAERINTFIALQFLFDHFWKQLKVGGRGGWQGNRHH